MVRKKLLKSKAILLSLIAATAITTLSVGTTKASAANIPMKLLFKSQMIWDLDGILEIL